MNGSEHKFNADGVFIYVGMLPLSKPLEGLGITNQNGYIETNELMETRVPIGMKVAGISLFIPF